MRIESDAIVNAATSQMLGFSQNDVAEIAVNTGGNWLNQNRTFGSLL